MTSGIYALIEDYYGRRNLVWPDGAQAALWTLTELAEAVELELGRQAKWVRNHPESKERFSRARLAEELGDVLMMTLVWGMTAGIDPLAALTSKLRRGHEG